MTTLNDEAWLARRMRDHGGGDVFQGLTDIPTRRERMREAIRAGGLAAVVVGASERKPVTWSAAFERLYGEAL
jgi:hypothetical protein